jgi:hypothetical protein
MPIDEALAAGSGDGREIFYRNGDRMMVMELKTTASGRAEPADGAVRAPVLLWAGITIANYGVTSDGQRFLMVKDEDNVGPGGVTPRPHPCTLYT